MGTATTGADTTTYRRPCHGPSYPYGYPSYPQQPQVTVVYEQVPVPVYNWVQDPYTGQWVQVQVGTEWRTVAREVIYFPEYGCHGYRNHRGVFIRIR